jgi:hypothetical protein
VTGMVVEAGGTMVVKMSVDINGEAVGAAVVSAMRLARMMSLILYRYELGGSVVFCLWVLRSGEVDGDARESATKKRTSSRRLLSIVKCLQGSEICGSEHI